MLNYIRMYLNVVTATDIAMPDETRVTRNVVAEENLVTTSTRYMKRLNEIVNFNLLVVLSKKTIVPLKKILWYST